MSHCGKLKLVLIVTRCGKREWNSGFNNCNCGNKIGQVAENHDNSGDVR